MAGGACSLSFNVKDKKTGKVKVSELWKALEKFFKKDRKEAIVHYLLTKDSNFLMENSDLLEFDVDGEVTIDSLKKALDRNGEYANLSNNKVREQLNEELKAGKYDYTEALDNVLQFNRSNKFRENYMATLRREKDGKYSIEVVKRNSDEEYKLADHVQNKILTDAVMTILKDNGLSVEFLENPSFAAQYNTQEVSAIDGLSSIGSVLNGINTQYEVAEVAGHFLAAAMKDGPLMQRLLNQLTKEVQKELFSNPKSEFYRPQFIVHDNSAMEAAGILIGHQLISPFNKTKMGTAAKIGAGIAKGIKYIIRKIGEFAAKIFRMYTPDKVHAMAMDAKNMAANVAQGYLADPSQANVDNALNTPVTYTSKTITKKLADDVRTHIIVFNDAIEQLKDTISEIKSIAHRAGDRNTRELYKDLKDLQEAIIDSTASQLNLEAFAKHAALEGMVSLLDGLTTILDTNVRTMLEAIQPANRTQSYASMASNARNMMAVNVAAKKIGQLYQIMSDRLSELQKESVITSPSSGETIEEALKDAIEKLGQVLVGNEETYTDVDGTEVKKHGLQEIIQAKRRQIFIDSLEEFFGRDTIEYNAGIVFAQKPVEDSRGNVRYKRVLGPVNTEKRVSDFVDSLETDIDWFDRYLSSAADCGDLVTAIGYKITREANMQSDRLAMRFWDKIEELRLQMEDLFGHSNCNMLFEVITDSEGHKTKTGNLVTRTNYGAWERDRKEFAEKLRDEFNQYLADHIQEAYRKNKGVKGYSYYPTDNERAALYHIFADEKWKEWHEGNAEKGLEAHSMQDPEAPKNVIRYIPESVKYHNTQWDELFGTDNPTMSSTEREKRRKQYKWYKSLLDLKGEMDALLPKNATVKHRAPQMQGGLRFSHRFRNLRDQMGGSLPAFGTALRRKAQDLWKVREDEAWMFGSNNEFNELSDDVLENELFFEKEKTSRIPLYGINKLKDMSNLSTDLFGTLMEYGSMAATYNAMERVADVFELGRDVLKNRRVGSVVEKERKEESRSYSRYAKFIQKNIYNVAVNIPKWQTGQTLVKIVNGLSSFGGRILLWGNFHGGIVNTGTGMFEILKEAASGENFNFTELKEAHEMYFKGIMSTMGFSLIDRQRPDDLNALWIRHWNILSENRAFLRNQKFDANAMSLLDNRFGEWFGHIMMLPYSSGEHYMQTIPYYAMGIRTKVYDHDGNEMNLMQAYDVVEGDEVHAIDDNTSVLGRTPKKLRLKNKIFRSVGDITRYDTVVDMLNKINDFFEANKNARGNTPIALDMFSPQNTKYLNEVGFRVPQTVKQLEDLKVALQLKLKDLTFNERDESEFMDKCRNICNRLHGIYNTEDKVAFQQNFYGNLVMAMRGYALGMINRRYAPSKYNISQRKVVEGSYDTAFKVLCYYFSNIFNSDLRRSAREAIFMMLPIGQLTLLSKKYGEKLKADMIKAGWSPHQYYNIRRASADFLMLEVLALTRLAASPGKHFGLNADDEEVYDGDTSAWIQMLYYFCTRWFYEQGAFTWPPAMFFDMQQLLDYVPVGLSGCKAFGEIVALFARTMLDKIGGPDYTNSDLYYQSSKDGKYEQGDPKWLRKAERLTPYWRSKYPLTHGYDATTGYEYGRKLRGR